MKSTILSLVVVFFAEVIFAKDKPNFVWIISEDNSIHYLDDKTYNHHRFDTDYSNKN